MNPIEITTFIFIGTLIGFVAAWTLAKLKFSNQLSDLLIKTRTEIASLSETVRGKTEEIAGLRAMLSETGQEFKSATATIIELKAQQAKLETIIEKERAATGEKLALLEDVQHRLTDTYQALSASALQKNNQAFLDLAQTSLSKYLKSAQKDLEAESQAVKNLVTPIKEALERYDFHTQEMERTREKAYGGLSEQVASLLATGQSLQKETGNLVKALRVPHVRGRWGEMTLKRVSELSGMQSHCDFFEQQTAHNEENISRPDMIVHLPGGRLIIVDAKVPIAAYLEALEAQSDEQRQVLLEKHAKQLQTHILQLAQKSYWTQFNPTPEFVVLFIPGENFFSAALTQNPRLIENGADRGVILATPTTLISLLKTIAFGWRQEVVAENTRAIGQLGHELYGRLHSMAKHINKLGRDIERCSATYNQMIGSFEQRVLTSARKFKVFGI
ncbi:MAG: DNA recombination protein RmuC, partial [Desulfobacterales bacterium]|nr:DNA recombination protein RmuC [Desulfobacterales bacterium]